MELQIVQLVSGSLSSLIFIGSNLPMLLKAFRTKNLQSYSLSNLLLTNVSRLPIGPIWFMHTFCTVVEILMLVRYLHYERRRLAPLCESPLKHNSAATRDRDRGAVPLLIAPGYAPVRYSTGHRFG